MRDHAECRRSDLIERVAEPLTPVLFTGATLTYFRQPTPDLPRRYAAPRLACAPGQAEKMICQDMGDVYAAGTRMSRPIHVSINDDLRNRISANAADG
jgi:hypothetical protein